MKDQPFNLPHRAGFYWLKREVRAVQQCLEFMRTSRRIPYQTLTIPAAKPFLVHLN